MPRVPSASADMSPIPLVPTTTLRQSTLTDCASFAKGGLKPKSHEQMDLGENFGSVESPFWDLDNFYLARSVQYWTLSGKHLRRNFRTSPEWWHKLHDLGEVCSLAQARLDTFSTEISEARHKL